MGGLTKRSATQSIPGDIKGLRQNNIDFLNQLLFPQGGRGGFAGVAAPGSGNAPGGGPGDRLQSFFGPLAPQGIQQFLNQPSPEQRALDVSMPALQEILTPGTSNPALDKDLALANSQGPRFGSANAILRSNALGNLFNLRTQAANTLGVLGQNAGAGQQRQAGLMDLETQRRLQLLMALLGTSQGAAFNVPFVPQQSPLDTLAEIGSIGAGLGANPFGSKTPAT